MKRSTRAKSVMVSYSRKDQQLVKGVVILLKMTGSHVFLDIDSIRPGEDWAASISWAIRELDIFAVIWCRNSSESDYVEKEWREALKYKKVIVPILLDETPLPPELAKFQWIDLRHLGYGKDQQEYFAVADFLVPVIFLLHFFWRWITTGKRPSDDRVTLSKVEIQEQMAKAISLRINFIAR